MGRSQRRTHTPALTPVPRQAIAVTAGNRPFRAFIARMIRKILAGIAFILAVTSSAAADDITVMSGGAPKEALCVLIPQFEKATGHRVHLTVVLVSSLRQRILGGESPDVVLLPRPAIENLLAAGKLVPEGQRVFGTVRLVAVVKNGAPQPDISTVDAFRTALLKARSVAFSTPSSTPSGTHMTDLISRLGIRDLIERKVTYRPALEGGVTMVADGKADIGIYPASEVIGVEGITSLGPLPDALQLTILYGGPTTVTNKSPEAAAALIGYLAAAENREVWQTAGFDPP